MSEEVRKRNRPVLVLGGSITSMTNVEFTAVLLAFAARLQGTRLAPDMIANADLADALWGRLEAMARVHPKDIEK